MRFLKTAIYIRVSTREQAESGYSIGEQEERLRKYCEAKDWSVGNVFVDPGYSGATIERPGLNALLDSIRAGEIDCVLCWKLDRLSRSQKDTLHLIEDVFLPAGVAFVSTMENFDTSSAFGRAMLGILSVFAQLEREQIRERMGMGLDARAKAGKWHGGGFDPFGYDYIDGRLVVNESEAAVVREVFHLYIEKRWAIYKIKRYLRERYTTKYSRFASDSSVVSILESPLYLGIIQWKGKQYQGEHEPIIDVETFEKAQRLRKENAWSPKGGRQKSPFDSTHLLGGLIFCGHCGARYFAKGNYSGRGENRRYYPYYTCYSRGKNTPKMIIDPDCKNKSYACEKLDAAIIEEIKKLSFSKKAVMDLIAERRPSVQTIESRKAALQEELKEKDEQIRRLIDLCRIGGSMPVQAIAAQIEGTQKDADGIRRQLEDLNAEAAGAAFDVEAFTGAFLTAGPVLESGSFEDKRLLVRSLIDRIIIEEDGAVATHWAFEAQ